MKAIDKLTLNSLSRMETITLCRCAWSYIPYQRRGWISDSESARDRVRSDQSINDYDE